MALVGDWLKEKKTPKQSSRRDLPKDSSIPDYPVSPTTPEETGLELNFIIDLTLKHILTLGEFMLSDLVDKTHLPASIIDTVVDNLRKKKFVEVKGATEYVRSTYSFTITDQGKTRAGELMEICRYIGPAPVPLEDYCSMIEKQTTKSLRVTETLVQEAFSQIVIKDKLLRRLGPAISSGKPIFLYGPPGNGKTTIAEIIGGMLPECVFMPHALIVSGQVINVFDPVTHTPELDRNWEDVDRRWIRVKRPVLISGGELSLKMLDLEFNPIAKFYEAPLQIKANNGLFIIDDFGRQQMDPQALLNRWIVNLDRNIDYLSLHTGMKFRIPFDQLVIFATNLTPNDLVDEAFLRRIRYKIRVDPPNYDEFKAIFQDACDSRGITFVEQTFFYLVENYYQRLGIDFRACHPRDLIEHIVDDSSFRGRPVEMTPDAIDIAWGNYFLTN